MKPHPVFRLCWRLLDGRWKPIGCILGVCQISNQLLAMFIGDYIIWLLYQFPHWRDHLFCHHKSPSGALKMFSSAAALVTVYTWLSFQLSNVYGWVYIRGIQSRIHPWSLTARPWNMMVGRWLSFWDGLFSGAILNFRGVPLPKKQGLLNCWWHHSAIVDPRS